MPESPALAPAVRAAESEERELREYAAAIERAEEDRRIIQYAAAVEKAKVEEERRILEYAAALEVAEQARIAEERRILRYVEAVAAYEAREREAIGMGEALLARQCPNGGQYVYWTDPPRAEVTQCYARQVVTSGQRTGAICMDGTRSSATGRGACSWHGGVNYWLY